MKFHLFLTAMLLVCRTLHAQVSDKYTELGYFAIAKQGTILPVQLAAFEATKREKSVLLSWETVTETNSSYFAVERSVNGTDFKLLTTVQAVGNSTSRTPYQTRDNEAVPGKNYYRLIQYDRDGKATVSPVKMIELPLEKMVLKIYPNPLSGTTLYVQVAAGNYSGQITLTDAQGKKLFSSSFAYNPGVQAIRLAAPLPAGLYFITLIGNGILETAKLMVK